MLRLLGAIALTVTLAGCVTESTGAAAARMEAQDDASCQKLSAGKGAGAYQQCRQNLMAYRHEAMAERAERRREIDRAGDAMQEAGAALSNIR